MSKQTNSQFSDKLSFDTQFSFIVFLSLFSWFYFSFSFRFQDYIPLLLFYSHSGFMMRVLDESQKTASFSYTFVLHSPCFSASSRSNSWTLFMKKSKSLHCCMYICVFIYVPILHLHLRLLCTIISSLARPFHQSSSTNFLVLLSRLLSSLLCANFQLLSMFEIIESECVYYTCWLRHSYKLLSL